MMKLRPNCCKYCGITLVELLIAVIVFAVIMLSGVAFFTFSNKSFGDSKQTTFAIDRANAEMDRLKTAAWDTVVTGTRNVVEPRSGITYRISWTVTNDPATAADPAFKNLMVAVTWPQGRAPVELTSIRARP